MLQVILIGLDHVKTYEILDKNVLIWSLQLKFDDGLIKAYFCLNIFPVEVL